MKKINMITYWDIVIVLQLVHLHIYIPVAWAWSGRMSLILGRQGATSGAVSLLQASAAVWDRQNKPEKDEHNLPRVTRQWSTGTGSKFEIF